MSEILNNCEVDKLPEEIEAFFVAIALAGATESIVKEQTDGMNRYEY